MAGRQIHAEFDEDGVIVYQAFKSSIADESLRLGTFGKGFNLERMTWIKPSFGWMLYRSLYGTKHRQERILKIKLSHEGFLTILAQGVPTSFDSHLFARENEWRAALDGADVRYQWDPDRDVRLRRLDRRALQIGMRGAIVRDYVSKWVRKIDDVTELARRLKSQSGAEEIEFPDLPRERVYDVPHAIQRTLGMI